MKVDLILVEYDSGRHHFGTGNGPQRLLDWGLSERLEANGHTVRTRRIEPTGGATSDAGITFDLSRGVSTAVRAATAEWSFPLVLSGNCSAALGAVAGLQGSGAGPAVCWLDAHGDFNTPDTTRSGYLDGMALATLTGRTWKSLAASIPGFAPVPEWKVVLLGSRDLDLVESEQLDESAIVRTRWNEAGAVFDALETETPAMYLHVDLDVFDPSVGKANKYAAPGGMTVDDVLGVLESARRRFDIVAASLTSYDPGVDPAGKIARAAIDIAQGLLH